MSTLQATNALRDFLETAPANTPVEILRLLYRSGSGWLLKPPQIALHCEFDNGLRRFDPLNRREEDLSMDYPNYLHITYICRDCQGGSKTFAILINPKKDGNEGAVEVMKLGEYPPFSAPISSKIQKLLSPTELELYRKGTRAEAQGLGIGAATYFRRIVEMQWKCLVEEIRKAAERLEISDLDVYDKALQETQFKKAVDMLKGKIPNKLLILDGKNPLTLLYKPLSQQLHELTDEECLQQAADIRVILTALLENIAEVLKDQNQLREAVARLSS